MARFKLNCNLPSVEDFNPNTNALGFDHSAPATYNDSLGYTQQVAELTHDVKEIEKIIPDSVSEENKLVTENDIPEVKVLSVNGKDGNVVLTASDIDTSNGDSVETALGNKVDILSGTGTKVYTHISGIGDIGTMLTVQKTANAIPVRDANGNFKVGDPVNDDDVANKKYVDSKLATDFTLIETITIEEDTNLIFRTGYDYKELLFRFTMPASSRPTETGQFNFGSDVVAWLPMLYRADRGYKINYKVKCDGGLMFCDYGATGGNTPQNISDIPYKRPAGWMGSFSLSKITYFQFGIYSTTIPAGTEIKIYAR